MSIDVNKLSLSTNIPKELTEINRLNSEPIKEEETEENTDEVAKKQEKKSDSKDYEKNMDTYKKSTVVSNSIEQQIQEQKAKIDEINKNLAVLRENYSETGDAEDDARSLRYQKERDLYRKEVAENSLKRIFANWTKKFNADKTDKSIQKQYNSSNLKYKNADIERIAADKEYDIADADAYDAIQEHNASSAQLLSGLWGKRDAYWDLAKMQQRLAFAKLNENLRQ